MMPAKPTLLAVRSFVTSPALAVGAVLCCAITLNALLLPMFVTYDPAATSLRDVLMPPSWDHLFGTDSLGRDIFVRVLYGLRSSWIASVCIIPTAAVIGMLVGMTASWAGGWVDVVLMRIVDVFLAFPVMIFALAIAAMLGPSLLNASIALSAVWWTWYARVSRNAALSSQSRGFVIAAQTMGVASPTLILRHIAPAVLKPIIVLCALDVGAVILVLGALCFIGAGAQPPTPELGLMVSSGLDVIFTSWWVPIFPGAAVFLAALSANIFATGLRDRLQAGKTASQAFVEFAQLEHADL